MHNKHGYTKKHKSDKWIVLSEPSLVDDYGDIAWTCQYSDKRVNANDKVIYIGATIPNLNLTYACAHDAMPSFLESKKQFNECEANCNTCKNFNRLPTPTHDKYGKRNKWSKGSCDKVTTHPQVYEKKGKEFLVYPDDPMHMDCYEGR